MESGEDSSGRYGDGAPAAGSGSTESSGSPRPPVLTPEVESRSDLNGAFGALSKGFPEVIQRAKEFYTRHPTLVKTVGTVFVAALARRLFRGRPGRS